MTADHADWLIKSWKEDPIMNKRFRPGGPTVREILTEKQPVYTPVFDEECHRLFAEALGL